ncbi:MAG: UbiH/UbiF/VisC/COQ6 family ubiquinone biosynthesis hydroxylase [Burkholderiaceae bacterium]
MANDGRIAILGGGPIGLACALLLARRGHASIVIDARTLDDALREARLLALSRGTWQLLDPLLGAAPPRTAPIRTVHVSSAGEFGVTRIADADFDGVPLGATVPYGELLAALAAAVAAQPAIEVLRPRRATEIRQRPDAVCIALADGSTLEAPLAINAEGFQAGAAVAREARDWAVLADVTVRGPAPGTAFERFTREGPLALLPTPSTLGGAPALSLVWCMDDAAATRRSELADAAFRDELQAALGNRIGRVERVAPRRRHPLHQTLRERVREHRLVALGNAAQTLHPVAGQGFNLGMRDCATLADCLTAHEVDAGAALADYEARRRADRQAIAALTRWLPALFRARFAPLALARSIGLVALDQSPLLRRQLAQLLMFGVRE